MSRPYPHEGADDAPLPPAKRAPRWPALAMMATWFVGILWIVVYYVDPTLPVISEFGNWNLLAGFALLILGGIFALILAVTAMTSARYRP